MPSQLPIIEFETKRLICRQWRTSDLPSFARINADPKVMEFFPKLLSSLESNALAESFKDFIELYGFGFWAVELKESNEFIGFVGLAIPTIIFPFSPCVEIAWRIGSLYWGQGYATEAARKTLQIGFVLLELSEIVSFTTINNLRSRSVMKKLGMQEDRMTFNHPNLPIVHALREHCLYRLQRDQWSWIIYFKIFFTLVKNQEFVYLSSVQNYYLHPHQENTYDCHSIFDHTNNCPHH